MVKNITVGITGELADRMEEFKEVNWSAITRICIEKYINQRSSDQFEKVITKVQVKKNIEFKKGFDFLLDHIDKVNLNDLEYIATFEPTDPDEQDSLYSYLANLADEINPTLYERNIKINSQFLSGMRSSAKEILKRS